MKLYQSPLYTAQKPNWIKWAAMYQGDHSAMSSTDYLWQHAIEKTLDGRAARASREERTKCL
jgi:hypothetical protein